ncbi:unnamed protein product, partial [Medioppia subpectinata]
MSEPTLRCGADGCNEKFFTPGLRRGHQIAVHNRKRIKHKPKREQACDWPGCEWMGKGINVHKLVHTGERPHVCVWPDCGKSFKDRNRLKDHMNIHNNVRPYVCQWPGCEYSATCFEYLFRHKKFVHKIHVKTHYSTLKRFRSDVNECDYRGFGQRYYKRHMKFHSNQSVSENIPQNVIQRKKCLDLTTNAFICPINECHKSCGTDVKFKQHLRSVHSDGQYVCEYIGCENVFKTKHGLKMHQLIHKKAKQFHCPHNGCESKAISDRYLISHLKTHSTDSVCNAESIESVVKEAEPLTQYTKAFTLNTLERNQCFDPKTKTWKCPGIECQKSFKTRDIFIHHLRNVHCEPRFKCHYDGCDKIFNNKERLNSHLLVHKNDKKFKCDYKDCEYAGLTIWALKAHQVSHSADRSLFDCPVDGCGKSFKTSGGLKSHSRTHMSEPTLRCGRDGCSEKFFTPGQRRAHQIAVHNRKRIIHKQRKRRCDWPGCEYLGTGVSEHKRVHTGERPHVCVWPDCGKSYKDLQRFKDHMNIHNNVRPYVCQWPGCEYSATCFEYLYRHKKFVHKIPLLRCCVSDCQMILGSTDDVSKHLDLHISEPTIECRTDGCVYMFCTEEQRMRHKMIIHAKRGDNKDVNRGPQTVANTTSVLTTSQDMIRRKARELIEQIQSHEPFTQEISKRLDKDCDKAIARPKPLATDNSINPNVVIYIPDRLQSGSNGQQMTPQEVQHEVRRRMFQTIQCSEGVSVFICLVGDCLMIFITEESLQKHLDLHTTDPTIECGTDGCIDMFHTRNQLNRHWLKTHSLNASHSKYQMLNK